MSLLTREEAQVQAASQIREMRYGPEHKDYFWINDMHPRMIMHPFRTDLEGEDISDFADPNGKHLFLAFVETAQTSGEGYVDYMWQWKGDDTSDLQTGLLVALRNMGIRLAR
jgi:signal transduction histidine kinase